MIAHLPLDGVHGNSDGRGLAMQPSSFLGCRGCCLTCRLPHAVTGAYLASSYGLHYLPYAPTWLPCRGDTCFPTLHLGLLVGLILTWTSFRLVV